MNDNVLPPTYASYRFPAEISGHAVWRSCRFARGDRDVEALLAERGVIVTDEAIRQWCGEFGQQYATTCRCRRPQPGDMWHLDEGFSRSNGTTYQRSFSARCARACAPCRAW